MHRAQASLDCNPTLAGFLNPRPMKVTAYNYDSGAMVRHYASHTFLNMLKNKATCLLVQALPLWVYEPMCMEAIVKGIMSDHWS